MRIIDVTRPLSPGTIAYPGDPPFCFVQEERGDYRVSDLFLNTHAGTHIDAPFHYFKNGDTIDTVPFTHLIGSCRVLDVRDAGDEIGADFLRQKIKKTARILLRTRFSGMDRFIEQYPYLTPDAAQLITSSGIRCLGIDSPSVECFHCNGAVHRELLGHGCIIIELLDLSSVPEGDYTLLAMPLRLSGRDGSPARVVLCSGEE